MGVVFRVLFALLFTEICAVTYNVRELRCGICKAILNEVGQMVKGVSSGLTAKVGSHRLDEKGDPLSKAIPLARSETFLTDALERSCRNMENYARGIDKKTGAVRVVKLFDGADKMNPEMDEINPISDSDLNQSLFLHCEDIVDTYENEILRTFQSDYGDGGGNFDGLCIKHGDLCPPYNFRDELDL